MSTKRIRSRKDSDHTWAQNEFHKALHSNDPDRLIFIHDKFLESKSNPVHNTQYIDVEKDFFYRENFNQYAEFNAKKFCKKYDLNCHDHNGQTPLLAALSKASNRHDDPMAQAGLLILDIVKNGDIKGLGFDIEEKDLRGYNALQYAIESGHSELVIKVIDLVPENDLDNLLIEPWPKQKNIENPVTTSQMINKRLPLEACGDIIKACKRKGSELFSDRESRKTQYAVNKMMTIFNKSDETLTQNIRHITLPEKEKHAVPEEETAFVVHKNEKGPEKAGEAFIPAAKEGGGSSAPVASLNS